MDDGGSGAAPRLESGAADPGMAFVAEVAEVEQTAGDEEGDENDDGVGVYGHENCVGHCGD